MTTNQPTAPLSAEDWLERQDIPTVLYGADDSDFDIAKLCEDYAAQEVANLQAENERLGSLAEEWAGKYHAATTENERITQALAETVADVKLLQEALVDYCHADSHASGEGYGCGTPESVAKALAQTDKEAYR